MKIPKIFQRRKEDFLCEHCGFVVTGNGYTNHCPKCLYSKHVDVFPGDRKEKCGGIMEPIGLEKEHGEEKLIQKCLRCGFTKKNKVSSEDDFETLLAVARKMAATL